MPIGGKIGFKKSGLRHLKGQRCNKTLLNCIFNTWIFTKLHRNKIGRIKYNLSNKLENRCFRRFLLNEEWRAPLKKLPF